MLAASRKRYPSREMKRLRILLIAPECPWPADLGLKTHLLHVMQAWAPVCDLAVFGFYFTEAEAERWRRLAAREGFSLAGLAPVLAGGRLAAARVACLMRMRPFALARYRDRVANREAQAIVDRAAAEGRPFDWVAYEVFHTMMPLRLPPQTRQLLFPVDCYSLYYERMHEHASTLPEWLRTLFLRLVCRRMERRYRGLDSLVTVAAADAHALRRLVPGGQVEVVPVPAEVTQARAAGERRETPRVLVAGYFGIPTIARDTRLFLEAWSSQSGRPAAELVVWGRGARRAGLGPAAAAAGARIVEWVDDYGGFLASGDIYVYPQRFACGVQTKVQQAMRAGLAVIAVPEVLDALDVTDGRQGLTVGHPREAARELAALLADPDRRERLGAAGAAWMESRFSAEIVRAQLQAVVGVRLPQTKEALDEALLPG